VARAVAPIHGVGGLERSVADLVRHLAARDVDVTLIAPPPRAVITPAAADPFASSRIHLHQVGYVTFPFANKRGTTILDRSTSYLLFGERAGRLAGRLAAAGAVDVVHGFGAAVLGYARLRSTRPAPLVFNPQGLEEFGATQSSPPIMKHLAYTPLRWAVRRCARSADCIIATDASLESTVERHLRPTPGQMRTIPNGIDLAVVSSLAGPPEGAIIRQRYGIGAEDFVLLSAGRLEENKGFDVLAAALAKTAAGESMTHLPWRWVIVGAGPERRRLEAVVERSGLGPRVIFAGRSSDADLHAWYEAASVFVHPTRYEGSSIVTLEAMAHRRPIIATRAGGLPDKVRPGVNGWLVEPGDADALGAAVLDAVAARSRLPAMGVESRNLVEREFSWARLVDVQIALYEELLARKRT
jgi:glycosyltransferase involved in cell wall biosynthesis